MKEETKNLCFWESKPSTLDWGPRSNWFPGHPEDHPHHVRSSQHNARHTVQPHTAGGSSRCSINTAFMNAHLPKPFQITQTLPSHGETWDSSEMPGKITAAEENPQRTEEREQSGAGRVSLGQEKLTWVSQIHSRSGSASQTTFQGLAFSLTSGPVTCTTCFVHSHVPGEMSPVPSHPRLFCAPKR